MQRSEGLPHKPCSEVNKSHKYGEINDQTTDSGKCDRREVCIYVIIMLLLHYYWFNLGTYLGHIIFYIGILGV